ncbi:hypothetical protein T484DRAFT_1896496 [Baffinella frigidus]|nr:hypothetical protein T484DRAFT_1896496 [Cryptophyta sp. CCMP2293]
MTTPIMKGKEEVAAALKRIVSKIGEVLHAGEEVEIQKIGEVLHAEEEVEIQLAHIGRLFGRGRRALFLFEPGYAPHAESAAAHRAGGKGGVGGGRGLHTSSSARTSATGMTAASGASGGAALRMLIRNGGKDPRGSKPQTLNPAISNLNPKVKP